MEYTLESYAVLFTPEYGKGEDFVEEFGIVSRLLEVKTPEEVIFTTSEDGEIGDYEKCSRIVKHFQELKELKIEISAECTGYALYDFEGVKVVMVNYPFDIFFIKISDKEKFDELTDKI